jgi:hypothetical protein
VHQHQPHAQRSEQIQIDRKLDEAAVVDELAAERDDEGPAAERVNIGRDRLEPVDEAVLAGQPRAARRRRCFGANGGRFRARVFGSGNRLPLYIERNAPCALVQVHSTAISNTYHVV